MGCVQAHGLGDTEQARGIAEGGRAAVERGRVAGQAAGLDERAQDLHRPRKAGLSTSREQELLAALIS